MNRLNHCASLTLLLVATSCSTAPEDCDPRRADFLRNTGCLASGAFGARQARLETELARERQRNRAFQAVLSALEEEKAAVASQLHAGKSRYERLDATWRQLRGELLRDSTESASLERQIRGIDEQMARRKSSGAVDVEQKLQERESLRRRLSLLQSEIDAGVYK